MGILSKIIASKRAELPGLRAAKLPQPPATVPNVNLRRIPGDPLHLICEIKQKSPSAGQLSTALTIAERARVYQANGASMISVLCDGPFFGGSYDHLLLARQDCSLPLLCKEFIIDELQLDAARAYGASAVLLIVRCLDDLALARLVSGAQQRGLVPLVEVYTEPEAQRALDAGAKFVGVNARDLDTLEMDAERARLIVQGFPGHVTVAHLSGIKTAMDTKLLSESRADAALIGEVLMRLDDPSARLIELRSACG